MNFNWARPFALTVTCSAAFPQVSLANYEFETGDLSGSVDLSAAAFYSASKNANFGLGVIDFRSGEIRKKNPEWQEYYLKPGASLEYTLTPETKVLAGGSVVAGWTEGDGDAGGYTRGGAHNTSLEELYAGIQIGAWKLTAGNQNYQVGNGLIVMDGNLDQFGDGSYYMAPRTAFRDSVILGYENSGLSIQTFSLRQDDHLGDTRLTGINADYNVENIGVFGLMALEVDSLDSRQNQITPKEGMRVYNARALNVTIPAIPNLTLNGEYAIQRGDGDGIKYHANAWYASADYQFVDLPLQPSLGYRYAYFSGDNDPTDSTRADWDTVSKGYTDWGTWVIGEVTGNYLLYSSNQKVSTWRLKTSVAPGVFLGAQYHQSDLDTNSYYGIPVTSKDFANELDLTAEWAVNENWYLAAVYATVSPQEGAKQALGDEDFNAVELMVMYHY